MSMLFLSVGIDHLVLVLAEVDAGFFFNSSVTAVVMVVRRIR